MPYAEYLRTPEWRRERNRVLRRARFKCERCPSRRFLSVHHRTYERLGCERDTDLVVLCATCHEGAEVATLERKDPDALYLRLARAAIAADRESGRGFASLSDLAEILKTFCAHEHIPYDSGRLTRALELVGGSLLPRIAPRRPGQTPPDPEEIGPEEAHAILSRLGVLGAVRTIEPNGQSPSNGACVFQQAIVEQRLRLLREQLAGVRTAAERIRVRRAIRELGG